MTTFVAHGQSYQAEEGCHDDIVMTLVLFGWMIEQRYFKEVTDMDLREKLHAEQLQEMEESVMPFGFIQNGIDEEETVTKMGGENWIINKDYIIHNTPYN